MKDGGASVTREVRRRPGQRQAAAASSCLLLLAAVAFAGGAQAAALEVYGRLPHLEDVSLSPDGARIAFVRTDADTRTVAVVGAAKGERLVTLRVGEQKLRALEWADNDHLMIMTSLTGVPFGFSGDRNELFQLQIYDLKSAKLFMVPEPDRFSDVQMLNIIAGLPMVRSFRDHTVIFVPGLQRTGSLKNSAFMRTLTRVDLDTHATAVVRPAKLGNLAWTIDGDGEVVAEETYDQRNGQWAIFIRRAGQLQQAIAGVEPIDYPRIIGLGPSPGTLLLRKIEDGESIWCLLSLTDGSVSEPIGERRHLSGPIQDGRTHRMVGGVHVGDSAEYVFFDPVKEQSWQAVLRAFPGEHVHLASASDDFRKLIVQVEGNKDGYGFELVDLDSHRAEPLGDVYEGVTKPFAVRRINYPAGDGLKIPAYLTLPRDKPALKLPLVVLPHGGPAVRDTADFDWWSQALAEQGYAVLRPNYRGSALGWTFISRGFGEWGRKMQTDLSDGVRYLAQEGIIDPTRVCIVGASYGGYAALAGPSLDPGIHRCAVSVAGISDITRLLHWVNQRAFSPSNVAQRYWDRFMGLSGPNDPAADVISPIKHLDAVKVPVLLIHGKDDTVVPFEQSQLMYDALHGARKDVQLVALNNEDHWLSRSETRLQMLKASVEFLRAHNPPD